MDSYWQRLARMPELNAKASAIKVLHISLSTLQSQDKTLWIFDIIYLEREVKTFADYLLYLELD